MPLLQQSVDISCSLGPQQQTCTLQQSVCCCRPLLDRDTDGQTDSIPFHDDDDVGGGDDE